MAAERKGWLAEGLIREESLAIMSGKEGSYKSFIALDLAYSVAMGRPWLGQSTTQGDVVYVLGERGDFQRDRLEALHRERGIDPDAVAFVPWPFELDRREQEQAFIDLLKRGDLAPRLIIIDTLRACFAGNENDNQDAYRFMSALGRIRSAFGACVLAVAHVTKNNMQALRGSGVFAGAVDHELHVRYQKGAVTLKARKTNHGKMWLGVDLSPREVGTSDGYTSIVMDVRRTWEADAFEEGLEDEDAAQAPFDPWSDANLGPILGALKQGPKRITPLQQLLKEMTRTEPNRVTLRKRLDKLIDLDVVELIERDGATFFGLRAHAVG